MSIFSRKSKAAQPQAASGKSSGHAYPKDPKANAKAVPAAYEPPLDPIVQRMAIQAASRKRMNSETPDYSIQSASSSPVIPRQDFTRDISPLPSPNRLTKSSTNVSTAYSRRADPDTQKMRMPPRDLLHHPKPHVSQDSGYASVGHASTMDSRSVHPLNDPELLRRHRRINASLPRGDDAPLPPHTQSLTSNTIPMKARTAPSTPNKRDSQVTDTTPYVSRLDPGSASGSFRGGDPVVPVVSRRRPSEERGGYIPSQVSPRQSPRGASGRRPDSARREEEFAAKPTPNMSRPRESPHRPAKLELLTNSGSPQSQPRRIEQRDATAISLAQRTRDQEMPIPRSGLSYDGHTLAMAAAATATAAAIGHTALAVDQHADNARSSYSSNATYVTPRETPMTSLEEPHAPALTSQAARSSTDSGKQAIPIEWSNPLAKSGSGDAPNLVEPQEEFPYLAGISQAAALPSSSSLEGFKVNSRGQILDEEGEVIGELASGEIAHCVRRRVNARGEIVDDSGRVVGTAVAITQPRAATDDDKPRANFANELVMSPLSPGTMMMEPVGISEERREIASTFSRQPRLSQRANSVPGRPLNNSDSNGNTVYFELDASADSQAAPLMDQSDIFIPPFGEPAGENSRSRSATNLTEIKRIAEGRRSTMTASSQAPSASLEDRRGSTWSSRYFDAETKRRSVAASTAGGAEQRTRSLSNLANGAPKAVLGPTMESLLDTVPDPNQSSSGKQAHKSVILDMSGAKMASQSSLRLPGTSPARAETMPVMASGSGGKLVSRSRRSSQVTVNTAGRLSTHHQTFAKSPLGSVGEWCPHHTHHYFSLTSAQPTRLPTL